MSNETIDHDGPRAGLSHETMDSDGDQEAADYRENVAGNARREALHAAGALHPLFEGVFTAHFPGMKYGPGGERR